MVLRSVVAQFVCSDSPIKRYTSTTAPNKTTTISTDNTSITTINIKYERSENLVINIYPFSQLPQSSVSGASHILR